MVTMMSASCGLGEVRVEALARVAGDAEQLRLGARRLGERGDAQVIGGDDLARPRPLPGGTSSSPVERMATRGRRRTGSAPWPMAAASDTSRGSEAAAGGQQRLAFAEVEAAVADVAVVDCALAHGDLGAVARRCPPG